MSVVVRISPFAINVRVGAQFHVYVHAETDAQAIDAVDVFLNFDPEVLQILSVTPMSTEFSIVQTNTYDNGTGLLDYSAAAPLSFPLGAVPLLDILCQAVNPATSSPLSLWITLPRETEVSRFGSSVLDRTVDATLTTVFPTAPAARRSRSTMTRNELIRDAYSKVGKKHPSVPDIVAGARALNLIIDEENLKGTKLSKDLYAIEGPRAILLQAGRATYGTADRLLDADPVVGGLADDIQELETIIFRDSNGDDRPVTLSTPDRYAGIGTKLDVGDVELVYLHPHNDLTQQRLTVARVPESATAPMRVFGSDGQTYVCTLAHTASAQNQPIAGPDWRTCWDRQGAGGAPWESGATYTSAPMLLYWYKRPLANFATAAENPDVPKGKERYLIYRLAFDLGTDLGITMQELLMLQEVIKQAAVDLFPSSTVKTNDIHNRALFY